MAEQIAYIIGVIANTALFIVGTNLSYRRGVKDGLRRAVINVIRNEGILTEESKL